MKRQDEWLREACARLAEEETEQLEKSMDAQTAQEADAIFKRHRRKILSLLAQNSKRKSRAVVYLRAAACLVLIIGAVFISFTQNTPAPKPLAPVYSATVAPFHSPEPIPTQTPFFTVSPSPSPTFMQKIVPSSTPYATYSPSPVPTATPAPTVTPAPSPIPTALPTPAPTVNAWQEGMNQWTGHYFPITSKDGWTMETMEQGNQYQRVIYSSADGNQMIFTEYNAAQTIEVPDGASLSYVQLSQGIALRMETQSGVLLAWETDGRTLTLHADALADDFASSVQKIPGR